MYVWPPGAIPEYGRHNSSNIFQRLLFKDLYVSFLLCNVLRFVNYIINLYDDDDVAPHHTDKRITNPNHNQP